MTLRHMNRRETLLMLRRPRTALTVSRASLQGGIDRRTRRVTGVIVAHEKSFHPVTSNEAGRGALTIAFGYIPT